MPEEEVRPILSVNQVVAYNLRRAREAKGWTQLDAAAHLHHYLGEFWSRQRFSAAERVYSGETDRDFSVNELVAFARAFEFPLSYFLTPPPLTLDVFTALPVWVVYFKDEPEVGVTLYGRDLGSALKNDEGREVERSSGPHWQDAMPARDLLQLLGSSEAPTVAARLRALADELEAQT